MVKHKFFIRLTQTFTIIASNFVREQLKKTTPQYNQSSVNSKKKRKNQPTEKMPRLFLNKFEKNWTVLIYLSF